MAKNRTFLLCVDTNSADVPQTRIPQQSRLQRLGALYSGCDRTTRCKSMKRGSSSKDRHGSRAVFLGVLTGTTRAVHPGRNNPRVRNSPPNRFNQLMLSPRVEASNLLRVRASSDSIFQSLRASWPSTAVALTVLVNQSGSFPVRAYASSSPCVIRNTRLARIIFRTGRDA